jgi:2-iminoacetate synthase
MELAKAGFIQKFCLPNGLLTFKEYLEDYASEDTKKMVEAFIDREIKGYKDLKQKKLLTKRIARIEAGARDLYL